MVRVFGGDPAAIVRRGERHRAGFQRLLGAWVQENPEWIRVCHPRLRGPLFNYSVPLRHPGPAAGAQVATVSAGAAAQARAAGEAGGAGPGRLAALFITPAAAGWVPPGLTRQEEQVVLALPLPEAKTEPAAGPGKSRPPDLRIWPLPPAAAADWAELLLAALGLPAELRPELRAAYAGMPERLAPGEQLRLYLAELAGRPVGTGLLYVDPEGQAGLYGAAVMAAYRGRGVGRALTRRRLADARALGAGAALVQTAPESAVAALWRQLEAVTLYGVAVYY